MEGQGGIAEARVDEGEYGHHQGNLPQGVGAVHEHRGKVAVHHLGQHEHRDEQRQYYE